MTDSIEKIYKDFSEMIKNKGVGVYSLGGWITVEDKAWLMHFLQQIPQPETVVEVGTFMGDTSNILLWLTGNSKYYAIDDWAAGDHQAKPAFTTLKEGFLKTTEWAKERITLIEMDSRIVGKNWETPIDLLYIDGNHAYEFVFTDIVYFGRWVRPGGHILIDDYEMGPVIQATDELITSSPIWRVIRRPDFLNKNNPKKLFVARRV